MGIFPEKNVPQPVRIEDAVAITYADYVFDDSDDEQEIVVVTYDDFSEDDSPTLGGRHGYQREITRRSAAEARKAVRQANRAISHAAHDVHQIKKNMGARKWRRVENARILAAFVDPDDVYYDSRDLIPDTVSAFARLLSDEAGMRAWNAFIDQETEEEQSRFLENLKAESKDGKVDQRKPKSGEPKNEEKRTNHPAFSARACFQSLDKRFQTALTKRHNVPMTMIEEIEGNLRAFFSSKPNGRWAQSVESSYKRFYLHAVAQFLSLKSQSQVEFPRGLVTTIENPQNKFEPPPDSLSRFLNHNPRMAVK